MWRPLITLVFHRSILLAVALFALSHKMDKLENAGVLLKSRPLSQLLTAFSEKIKGTVEWQAVTNASQDPILSLLDVKRNPFISVCAVAKKFLPFSTSYVLLLVSNLFLLLLLWEIVKIMSQIGEAVDGVAACTLLLFWPSSYELSMGSSLVFTAWAMTFTIRKAINNHWVFCGIGLALALWSELSAIALIPLLLYLFWYFERHFQLRTVILNAFGLFIPFILVALLKGVSVQGVRSFYYDSALFYLIHSVGKTGNWQGLFSQSLLGQTIAVVFLLWGSIVTLFHHSLSLHRWLPSYFFTVFLFSSPYGSLGSRMAIAGICLEGVAMVTTKPILWTLELVFLILGGWEVFLILLFS